MTKSLRSAATRLTVRRTAPRYLALPLTAALFWLLHRHDLISHTSLWLQIGLLMTAGVVSTFAHAWWPKGSGTLHRHARLASETAAITAAIYATGWGPTGAIGYVFDIVDNVETDGSKSARPALLWCLAGLGVGQAAVALGWAPSLVPRHLSHGLAALTAMGLALVAHVAHRWTAGTEDAEEVLRRSEQRFRSLVQNAADVVSVTDRDGMITYVSPALTRMLGYKPEELVGLRAPGFVLGDDFERATRLALRTGPGRHASTEVRARHRNGSWRQLQLTLTNLMDDPDVGGFVVNARDVTERRRAETELRVRAAQQAAVVELGERALRGVPLTKLLEDAMAIVAKTLDAPHTDLLRVLPGEEAVALEVAKGWDDVPVGWGRVSTHNGSAEGYVLRSRVPLVVDDFETERRFATPPLLARHGVRSSVSVIVQGRERETPFGLLRAHADRPRAFSADDVRFLQAVANVLAAAIERKRAEAETEHRALHDPLTGLPNRALLLDRLGLALARMERQPGSIALLFLDLDRFKLVNDSLGHDAGDRVLVEVARRLGGALRPGDTVARFGGDEFAVLCEQVSAHEHVAAVARRIHDALASPIQLDEEEVSLSASIGIATAVDGDVAPQDLLRDADAAMYRAKERRSGYEIFDEGLRRRALERLETETAIRHALEREELRVFYQPEVDLRDGRIVGAEALVRWEHPQAGWVLPDQFIPLAEECGLIQPIGTWVLRQACEQAVRWQRSLDTPFTVAVNLSARQLIHPQLVDALGQTLADTGLDPSCLSLEITESVLMEDAEFFLESLLALRIFGVRLAIDDFGTGYSSLAYLKRFPVDVLKLDRSFVHGLGQNDEDRAIVAAVVRMADALGLDVVAEGVETAEQAEELRTLGCRTAQGFYFAKPQPPQAVDELLTGAAAGRIPLGAFMPTFGELRRV